MVGWLVKGGPGRRPVLDHTLVGGLPLAHCRVPEASGWWSPRPEKTLDRAARLLERTGCRRVLVSSEFDRWDVLARRGLRPVEGERLAQALAAPAALALLERRGVDPTRGAVGLYGGRVGRACFEAALALCPAVGQLTVDIPDGGEDLARYLREEFGAAVLEGRAGRQPDVCLCFAPADGLPPGTLTLWGARPCLGGLTPRPRQLALPPEADPLSLTALLWEEGRVDLEEIGLDWAGE